MSRVLNVLALLAVAGCAAHTHTTLVGGRIALVGGTVYMSPDLAPIRNAIIVIEGGTIREIGEVQRVLIAPGTAVLDVSGLTILPAFWNSHVHLTEPKWSGVDSLAADSVSELLQEMFTRFGFVHVVDVGSFVAETRTIIERLETGGVRGPDVLSTFLPFVPPDGTPIYVTPLRLPELHGPVSARDSVRVRVAQGASGIKLFTVPITSSEPFPIMSAAVVSAVAEQAHSHGLSVFAHPTNLLGIRVAVAGGVDILAHTAPVAGAIPDTLLGEMLRQRVALIPTLTLWESDFRGDTAGLGRFIRAGQEQVRTYATKGGRILFGTDVGYLPQYDPTREYELMSGAGLAFGDILRSMTLAPAAQFGWADRTGRIARGMDADIVVVEGDPVQDIRALARVRLTMKRGQILFEQPAVAKR